MKTKWVVALAACLGLAVFWCGYLVGSGRRKPVEIPIVVVNTEIEHTLSEVQGQIRQLLADLAMYPKYDTIAIGADTVFIDSSTAFGDIPVQRVEVKDSFAVMIGETRHQFEIGSWFEFRGMLYRYGLSIPRDQAFATGEKPAADNADLRFWIGVSVVPKVIPEAQAEVVLWKRIGGYGRVEFDSAWKWRAGVKAGFEL